MASFLLFFLLFDISYPYIATLAKTELSHFTPFFSVMLFYTISELWKPILTVVLFWGLVNQFTSLSEAKKLYGPMMLGGSLGTIAAAPIISFFTQVDIFWTDSLHSMMIVLFLSGLLASWLYIRVWKIFSMQSPKEAHYREPIHLSDSISYCIKNPQLRSLSWIVIADYISYSVGEVIFLDLLKEQYPDPLHYCAYMGNLSFYSGLLTLISSLWITPFILTNYRWVVAALITPICLLITEGSFFVFLRGYSFREMWFGGTESQWLHFAILLGAIQYCVCRAAKYTLFDSSKEMAFLYMPDFLKMHGKVVIDGICARIGRGTASCMSLTLAKIFGGVMASSSIGGAIAIGFILSWLKSSCSLGKSFELLPERQAKPITQEQV
jgi:AAA family ATP:ADP antiporter